ARMSAMVMPFLGGVRSTSYKSSTVVLGRVLLALSRGSTPSSSSNQASISSFGGLRMGQELHILTEGGRQHLSRRAHSLQATGPRAKSIYVSGRLEPLRRVQCHFQPLVGRTAGWFQPVLNLGQQGKNTAVGGILNQRCQQGAGLLPVPCADVHLGQCQL